MEIRCENVCMYIIMHITGQEIIRSKMAIPSGAAASMEKKSINSLA